MPYPFDTLKLDLSYSLTRSSLPITDRWGDVVPYKKSPTKEYKVGLSHKWEGWSNSLSYKYKGRSMTGSWGDFNMPYYNDGIGTLRYSSGYQLSNAIRLNFSIDNLLQESTRRYVGRPELPGAHAEGERLYSLSLIHI